MKLFTSALVPPNEIKSWDCINNLPLSRQTTWRISMARLLLETWALNAIFRYATLSVINSADRAWHDAEKKYLGLLVPLCLLGLLYGPFAGVTAAPDIAPAEIIKKEVTEIIVPDNSAPTAPAPAPNKLSTFKAVVTQYSRADSCHTVKKGKCIMASGRPVYVGAAACPDFLKLETQINVAGKTYTCEDRYAKWLDRRRRLPTVDLFVDNNPQGNSIKLVTIAE